MIESSKFFSRLQTRILLGIVAVLVVTIGGLFYLLRIYYHERLDRNMESYGLYLSQSVENSFEFAMSVHNMEGLKEAVEHIDQDQGVKRIFLVNKDGRIVMGYPEDEVGSAIPPEAPSCLVCHRQEAATRQHAVIVSEGGEQILRVAVPLRNQPQCWNCHGESNEVRGMVVLDYALEEVRGSLSPSVVGMTSLFTLTTAGLVVAIGLIMNRLVVARLNRLADAARDLGRGDFNKRVEVSGGDEIDRLGNTFNAMAESLERSTRKIEADRDFLDRLINSIQDEIFVYDSARRVVAANQAAATRTRSVPIGVGCETICAFHDNLCGAERSRCLVKATFESGKPQRRIHTVAEDRGNRTIEVLTTPIHNADRQAVNVVCICRDITEWRAMERELIRSERLASLGRLAAGVAHEINNPMASIAACAEGLQRRLKGVDLSKTQELADLPEYLDIIRNAAFESKDIAGRLLNLSRSAKVEIQFVDPNEIIDEVVTLLQPEAAERRQTITVDLAENLPQISADRARLGHALANLIHNGLDASEDGSEVRVISRLKGDDVQIVLEDSGCGIAESDMDRIFEPFFTTKAPGKGTGLGLSISERTVRDHGGRIEVENRRGSEGSRFTISLPGAKDDHGEGRAG